MLFTVIDSITRMSSHAREMAFLIRDNTHDQGEFVTKYSLFVFDAEGVLHEAGPVKIGQFGMKTGTFTRPDIPETFDALDERFFSLGQDENYYETLHALTTPLRGRVVRGLRDVADDLTLFDEAHDEQVMRNSLLRHVHEETVRHRLHHLAKGDARHTGFKFTYVASQKASSGPLPLSLSFEVMPESLPPTNIHLLLGRNGAGKTQCLTNMARSLVDPNPTAGACVLNSQDDSGDGGLLSSLVAVSFSAFDGFEPLVGPHTIRYSYIGLRQNPDTSKAEQKSPPPEPVSKNAPLKPLDELAGAFVASVGRCRSGARASRWRSALEALEADPLFREVGLTELSLGDDSEVEGFSEANADAGWESRARHIYQHLTDVPP